MPTLVKDIHPGASATATAGPVIDRVLGVSSGRVFMNASVYDAALGLGVTDGTSAGTLRILDVAAGSGADVGGTFFFGVAPPWGVSLWRSDGTAAGTAFASPIGADPFSSGIHPAHERGRPPLLPLRRWRSRIRTLDERWNGSRDEAPEGRHAGADGDVLRRHDVRFSSRSGASSSSRVPRTRLRAAASGGATGRRPGRSRSRTSRSSRPP